MYATVEQVVEPCVAALKSKHEFLEGDVQASEYNAGIGTVRSWVCKWCLIEIDDNDTEKYREALRASAGLE